MKSDGYPLSLDWMAITLRLLSPVSAAPAGHRWACYAPTNVWASRWCLFNEFGEKVFTLLFQPRQSIIKTDRALLEVANEWLYHGLGVTGCLRLLGECCEFGILGVSRLDLACDFVPSEAQASVIRGLYTGKYYVAGKRNGNQWWSENKGKGLNEMWRGLCPHDMNWGHKTSDVKWKLYYKTKELKDESGGFGWSKPYIVDRWHEFGLDDTNVWRLEVSLKNCNNFDFMGEPLSFEKAMHNTTTLFKSLYTSRFLIRENQGHNDRTNDADVRFLDVGACRDAFRVHREERDVAHNSCLTLLRHLVADVQTEQVLLNDKVREATLEMIEKLLEVNTLGKYFHAVVGDSFESWREFLRVKAYYYGEEFKRNCEDSGEKMEGALMSAGVVDYTDEGNIAPLGAPSSMSPQRSATEQTRIMFNP